MSRITYTVDLATPADDAALRALLREIAMPGSVRLSYEREPSFFAADPPLGETVQTLVTRAQPGGPPVATASRATRTVFLGGVPTRIGYLSGLRVRPEHRSWRVVQSAWAAFRELHRADPVSFYLASVTAENEAARRFFALERGDAPRFVRLADVVTAALVVRGRKGQVPPSRQEVSRKDHGAPPLPPEGGEGRGEGGAPTPLTLSLSRGERGRREGASASFGNVDLGVPPHDLFPAVPLHLPGATIPLAVGGRRRGANGALWDPSEIRQTVVRGYEGALTRWRGPVNLALRAVGAQPLPEIGQPLRSAFLSQSQATDDRAHRALLAAALAEARRARHAFVLVGYDEADPYLGTARRWLHVPYRSTLYAAHWPDGAPPDLRRPVHAEIASY